MENGEHYKTASTECIDAMIELYGKDAVMNFCELNIFKYSWRLKLKDTPEKNVEKILWYGEMWKTLKAGD